MVWANHILPLGVQNWEIQRLGPLTTETRAERLCLGLRGVEGVWVAPRRHMLAERRQSKLRKAGSGK